AKVVLKDGSPELVKAVERGDVSVSDAAAVARTVPKAQQDEAVERVRAGKARTLRSAVGPVDMVDAVGMPVPRALRDAFGDDLLRNLFKQLKSWQAAILGAAYWAGAWILLEGVAERVEWLLDAVKSAVPYA